MFARVSQDQVRKTVFGLLAGYILLSPYFPQVLNTGAPVIRQWTMYSGVGQGVLKGEFLLTYADGTEVTKTPLEVQGLTRYPNTFHYEYDRLVLGKDQLKAFVKETCTTERNLVDMSFVGQVGTASGWLAIDVDHLCKADEAINV